MLVVDSGIKHAFMLLYAYIVFCIGLPEKHSRRRYFFGGAAAVLIGGSMLVLKNYIFVIAIPSLMALFYLAEGMIFHVRPKKNLTLTLISFGFSYGAFYLSVAISTAVIALLSYGTAGLFGSPEQAMDYYSYLTKELPIGRILLMTALSLLQGLLLSIALRSKRLRHGLSSLVKIGMSDIGVYISIATLSIMMIYVVSIKATSSNTTVFTVCFFLGITCIFMLYYWIKNEIRSAYKSRIKENELLLLEKSIVDKDRLIEVLRSDNERLAEIIHKDNKLIPAMVMSVKKCAESMGSGSCDTSEALETADALEAIYAERSHAISQYESHDRGIISTGVTAVDAVLLYMSDRAAESGVCFSANVQACLPDMLSEEIDRREFDTMLADLTENAIIAAKQRSPGRVEVRFKRLDAGYMLEVLDSGENFSTDVLKNMGIKKTTTHKNDGGSGIGLMTFFRILRQSGASLTIEELPEGGQFTKSIRVTFDRAGHMRIVSYRADELKKELRSGRFEISAPDGERKGEQI